ncbi:MAG: hypothetical protein R2712_31290 [Vicinamibacterales bacterium]
MTRAAGAGLRLDREVDVPAGRNALGDARRPGEQALSVLAAAEVGDHHVATGLAGEPVGDERLEPVADFDPHLPVVDGQHDQGAGVAGAAADALAVVLEHLHRVAGQVPVRLVGVHGSDHDRVARRLLELPNQGVELPGGLAVHDAGKVVDRLGEGRGQRLRPDLRCLDQQRREDQGSGH